MVITDSLQLGQHRLLEVDNPLVVPCNVGIRFLITSADVLHAWALPQLGIKVDAVPGRLSQCISMVTRPGTFYGQCSEICGIAHAFMPIVVKGAPYSHVLPIWTKFLETPGFKYPTDFSKRPPFPKLIVKEQEGKEQEGEAQVCVLPGDCK
jgi:hypothetical protein